MTRQEAAEVYAALRTMYPDGEATGELAATYMTLLTAYPRPAAEAGIASLLHIYRSRKLPAWAVIEQAIHDTNPSVAAWTRVAAALDAGANVPPDVDHATSAALRVLGGWTTLLTWDGSLGLLRDMFLREYDQATTTMAPRQIGGGTKTLNLTGSESCSYCHDDGWVILLGTVRVHEVTYERGNTACRWCEAGEAVYRSVTVPHKTQTGSRWPGVPVDNAYTNSDVDGGPVSDTLVTVQQYADSPEGRADPYLSSEVRDLLGVGDGA